MTSMPTINDHMVVLFRRTGKRRGSYRSGRFAGSDPRVVLQRSPGCTVRGQGCVTARGEAGVCDENLFCMANPFPSGDFRF